MAGEGLSGDGSRLVGRRSLSSTHTAAYPDAPSPLQRKLWSRGSELPGVWQRDADFHCSPLYSVPSAVTDV
jgi:hypothetical protein